MNRILSLIGVVLVVGCGGPEPRDIETLLELPGGVYINPEDRQTYSGPVFEMEGDVITMTGSLKDGEIDGPWESYLYHNDGQLMYKVTYKEGRVKDGPSETHNPVELTFKGIYKDDEKCGEWFEFGETVTYPPC